LKLLGLGTSSWGQGYSVNVKIRCLSFGLELGLEGQVYGQGWGTKRLSTKRIGYDTCLEAFISNRCFTTNLNIEPGMRFVLNYPVVYNAISGIISQVLEYSIESSTEYLKRKSSIRPALLFSNFTTKDETLWFHVTQCGPT